MIKAVKMVQIHLGNVKSRCGRFLSHSRGVGNRTRENVSGVLKKVRIRTALRAMPLICVAFHMESRGLEKKR